MTEIAGLAMIVAVTGVAGWALGALAAGLGAGVLRFDATAPDTRCRRAERLALLPLAGAGLGVAALLLPALLKLAGLIEDHCLAHGLHHPHFCLRHLPAITPTPALASLMLIGLWPLVELVRVAMARVGEARLLAGIKRIAPARHGVITAQLDAPRAFLFGLRRPCIVVSTGLLRALTPAQRRAVLRHEVAHARAGDPARRFVLGFLLALHLPPVRARLRRCWQQAAEERADDRVAAGGQGLELADALVAILRKQVVVASPSDYTPAADSADVARRIRRLAEAPCEKPVTPWFERLLVIAGVLIGVIVTSHHHAIETAVGWLMG